MSAPVLPFWLAQALAEDAGPVRPPLSGEQEADLCIVGGGFTGLWTAILTRQARPDWRIVLLEKARCGSGASGRNGGCLLTWSAKLPSLTRWFGQAEALRLARASEQAVFDIADFCRQHGIDADLRLGGAVYAASNAAQRGALDGALAALSAAGGSRWRMLSDADTAALSGSAALSAGAWTDAAGSVQPAKLARGLARVAEAMGVEIHEHSAMTHLQETDRVTVACAKGCVRARQAVLAMNADMANGPAPLANSVLLVSSDMIITTPQPERIARLGLDRGQAVCDLRTFVHYWRASADGRLMLGKGGNQIAFGNRMLPYFDAPSPQRPMLEAALTRFFPDFSAADVQHSWTGASDRSASGFPFFGWLPGHRRVCYGMGYSGNGVAPSRLGGEVLRDMLLGVDSEWTRSPLVRGPLAHFPPEPWRWPGAMLVREAIRRVERAEDAGRQPAWLARKLAGLASMAGKADR